MHDQSTVADLIGTGVDVKPGYISTFIITPSQTITYENTKHLTIAKRQCQFKDETYNSALFKDYRQVNCIFECEVETASNKCGCIPWDYPFLNNSVAICDAFGRFCFKKFMEDPKTIKQCEHCAHDCTTTGYWYSIYSTKIDETEICSNIRFRYALEYGTAKPDNYRMPPQFLRKYEEILQIKNETSIEQCIERVKKMAIVNFQIDNQYFNRIKRTQRVTFADTLSNIGETNGKYRFLLIVIF